MTVDDERIAFLRSEWNAGIGPVNDTGSESNDIRFLLDVIKWQREKLDAAIIFRFGNIRVEQFGAGHWTVQKRTRSISIHELDRWMPIESFPFNKRDKALVYAAKLATSEVAG